MIPDLINGLFEMLGAVATWFNIVTILRHRQVKGFSPMAYIYFTLWGAWNLFYYPHLGQWFSFAGGAAIVASNFLYTGLVLWYKHKGGKS